MSQEPQLLVPGMDMEIVRHSCAHIMAQAVKELWPEAKLGIGPAIEDGFYYDFDLAQPLTDADLARIEERMRAIIASAQPFLRQELAKADARALLAERGESYKVELLDGLPVETVTVYRTGSGFLDLCRGPHVETTDAVKAFKLLSVAGAYWHGIETNPMLQRIYGTCFETEKELAQHLFALDQAKARDHRKLGPSLGLFSIFHEEAGAGLVFYHPKGALLRMLIEDFERQEHLRRGYQMVVTPHIMQAELWKASGHYDYYRDNMYTLSVEGREFVLKPMNCPGHILIYQSRQRSYRDLPLRLFELGTVYRNEKAGVLHGLLRVRGFTQDDAHIFCLPDQLAEEIAGVIDFVFDTLAVFGFRDPLVELSTRPEKSIGSDQDWQAATGALEAALKRRALAYEINEGDGAFYGPKIDIKLKDALKRTWQCATIQCDFALPKRFNLSYVDADGTQRQPVMLHRVLLGSIERFVGALIEHYNGTFPVWLAPVQAQVIPVDAGAESYARQVLEVLRAGAIRAELDARNETLNKRIRQAELDKIPYLLVVGERERAAQAVAVRKKGSGKSETMSLEAFVSALREDIRTRKQ